MLAPTNQDVHRFFATNDQWPKAQNWTARAARGKDHNRLRDIERILAMKARDKEATLLKQQQRTVLFSAILKVSSIYISDRTAILSMFIFAPAWSFFELWHAPPQRSQLHQPAVWMGGVLFCLLLIHLSEILVYLLLHQKDVERLKELLTLHLPLEMRTEDSGATPLMVSAAIGGKQTHPNLAENFTGHIHTAMSVARDTAQYLAQVPCIQESRWIFVRLACL